MKLYSFLLLLTIGVSSSYVNAQKSLSGFPKFTESQLTLTDVPFEENADAVILHEEGFMSIVGGSYQLTVRRRIKILTDKGIDQANISLLYYSKNKIERISGVKGQTINHVNGEYITTPLDSKEVFDVNVNELRSQTRFALPNVKVGSIIEYEYSLTSSSLFLIDPWDFQHDIPTLKSQFKVDIRAMLDYRTLMVGKRLTTKYKGIKENSSWELINIPSVKEIKYVFNPSNYVEKLRFQLAGYQSENGYKPTIETWKNLKQEVLEANARYANPVAVRKFAEAIPNGATELETLDNVLKTFKRNFKWNNYTGLFMTETQKDILDKHSGNSSDLNYLLNGILIHKGFNANLNLISSRSHGKLLTSFPFLDQFNYVINTVMLKDGSNYVINAAEIPEDNYRYAPLYIFNDYGFNLSSKEASFVELHQTLSENTVEFKYGVRNGEMVIVRKDAFNGYIHDTSVDKKDLIHQYVNPPIEFHHDRVENLPVYLNDQYVSSNIYKIPFTAPDIIPIENPLKKLIDSYEFTDKDRTFNIEFDFPYFHKVILTVDIPEGYELIQADHFKAIIKSSDDLIYAQNSVLKDKKLQVMFEFYVGKASFKADQYNLLKEFFSKAQQESNKQFTLKKIK